MTAHEQEGRFHALRMRIYSSGSCALSPVVPHMIRAAAAAAAAAADIYIYIYRVLGFICSYVCHLLFIMQGLHSIYM